MKSKKLNPKPTLSLGAAAAFVVLLLGGGGHRWLDHLLIAADATPVQLDRPLKTLPLDLEDWSGSDVPLDERVLEVAGCDDYVSRRYVQASTGQQVDLYIAYAARPAKMLSHRPQVCYPAHGWSPMETRTVRLNTAGPGFDALVHRFSRGDSEHDGVLVLNYYVLRGKHVTEWTEFWGPSWRLPNLSRDPSFYVAQVQVSTRLLPTLRVEQLESLIKQFAERIAPEVDGMLPQTNSE